MEKRKGRYNFLLEESLYEEFSKYCEQEGLIRSKKVEHLIREFMESKARGRKHA